MDRFNSKKRKKEKKTLIEVPKGAEGILVNINDERLMKIIN